MGAGPPAAADHCEVRVVSRSVGDRQGLRNAEVWVQRVLRWRPGGYLRASGELFLWLGLRAGAQVLMVVVLARTLGAEGYGQFVTVLALASFFPPLVGLGTSGVLLRDGARRPELLPKLLRACLALWLRSLPVVVLLALFVALLALPPSTSHKVIAALVVSEVIASSLSDLVSRAEQARHRTRALGLIQAGLVLVRLTALAFCVLLGQPTAEGWMLAYALSNFACSGALWVWAHSLVRRRCAVEVRRDGAVFPKRDLMREGLPFLAGALSFRLQAEFNKPILARLGYAQAAQFGVAQRALDFAALPLAALQEALLPRVFSSENPGRRLFVTGGALVALALGGGAVVAWFAPWLARLIGAEFEPVARLIVWLAALPVAQVVRNLGNFRLVAEGRRDMLTAIHVLSTLCSVAMTAVLVGWFGVTGAVASAYGTELVTIIMQETLGRRRKI